MEFLGVSLSLLFARQIYFSRCPTNRLYLRSGRIATIFTSPIGCRLALWNLVFSNFIVVKSQVLCRPEKKYPLTSIVRNLPSVLELGKDYRSVKGIRLSLKVPDENHAVWKKTRDWENKSKSSRVIFSDFYSIRLLFTTRGVAPWWPLERS